MLPGAARHLMRDLLVQRMRAVALVTLMAGGAIAAEPPAGSSPGNDTHRLVHDGHEREYLLHLPSQMRPHEPVPLLISLHEVGSDAASHRRQTGFDGLAEISHFAVAYPQAWRAKPRRPRAWNTGDCCGDAGAQGIDDVDFVRAMLDEIAASTAIDRKRMYAVGMGNGAMLAHRLAIELPTHIAAIAAVAGTPANADFTVTAPVAVLQIHSADDPHALYGGGSAALPNLRGKVLQAGVGKTLHRWTQANQCAEYPKVHRDLFGALGTVTAGQRASLYGHPDCRRQKEVALWRLDGFGHTWPGGWNTDARGVTKKRTDIIDASREIWLWLSRFAQD